MRGHIKCSSTEKERSGKHESEKEQEFGSLLGENDYENVHCSVKRALQRRGPLVLLRRTTTSLSSSLLLCRGEKGTMSLIRLGMLTALLLLLGVGGFCGNDCPSLSLRRGGRTAAGWKHSDITALENGKKTRGQSFRVVGEEEKEERGQRGIGRGGGRLRRPQRGQPRQEGGS